MFKRPSESHSVLQGRGTLQLDVEAERVAEASHEDRDLLWLRDIGAPGNGREKLLLVVGHRSGALDVDELAQRVAAHRRPETEVDKLDKVRPGGHALVVLQAIVPLLGSALQVVGGEPDLVVVGGLDLAEKWIQVIGSEVPLNMGK